MWRWGRHMHRAYREPEDVEDGESAAEQAAICATRHDRIIEAATALGRITEAEVADLFCCSRRATRQYIHALIAAGRLRQQGNGTETVYVPVSTRGR